jgi:MFS family permease
MVRALAVVAVASLCGGLVFQSLSVGLPKVFDERGAGLVTGTLGIGGLVAVVYGVAGFAQIIVGHLIDKYAVKPVYVTIYLLEAPLLLAAAGLYDLPLLLVAVPFVFLNVGALPVLDSVVARYTPVEWRATIYGAKFVIGLGVSALGVPMVALIHDMTGGFTLLFVTLSGLALAIVAAGLFLPSERPAAPLPAAAGAPDRAD